MNLDTYPWDGNARTVRLNAWMGWPVLLGLNDIGRVFVSTLLGWLNTLLSLIQPFPSTKPRNAISL